MTTVAQRTVSRNDPCPCGSGRRYKDCHGALGARRLRQPADRGAAASTAAAAGNKSRYRPAGDDWAEIGADASDRLGAMMELALKHQVEQRVATRSACTARCSKRRRTRTTRCTCSAWSGSGSAIFPKPSGCCAARWRCGRRIRRSRRTGHSCASRSPRAIAAGSRSCASTRCRCWGESLQDASPSRGSSPPLAPAAQALHVVGPARDTAGDAAWVTDRLTHCWQRTRRRSGARASAASR